MKDDQKDQNSINQSQEHRAVPSSESKATSELDAAHDWRWLGWPLSDPNCTERWCNDCSLRQEPQNGVWVNTANGKPLTIERLVLSIATNQFTVPLPTGKEVVNAVNCHAALVAAAQAVSNVYTWRQNPEGAAAMKDAIAELRTALALANTQDNNTLASSGKSSPSR